MTSVTLHEGDNRAHLRRLIDQGVRVHSVVTDPPYGLTSVVKRFGKEGAAPAKHGTDGAFARASGGFMGKQWDGTGIERDPEFWRLIWEILLPGGFVFAFSGSRTGHWQACAMETAGFIMHPMHGWVYGSGMPKASNAERAVDAKLCPLPGRHYEVNLPDKDRRPDDHVCGSTMEGDAWAGWSYGTQAQKPALEPIYLGQKPFSEKTGGANLLTHGVGAVNIDGCRVPGEPIKICNYRSVGAQGCMTHTGVEGGDHAGEGYSERVDTSGRWPANLMHDGSDEVVALFPSAPGQQGKVTGNEPSSKTDNTYGEFAGRTPSEPRNDSGSAARFFNAFPPTEADVEAAIAAGIISHRCRADAIVYHGKATKADRAGSKHPTVKAIGLMEHLIRHVTPPGGVVLDPFAGSGTTAAAARRLGFDCIIMEQDPDYAAFLRQRFELPGGAVEVDEFDLMLGADVPDELDAMLG